MSVSLRKFVLSRCSTYAHAGGRKGWLHVYYLYASLIRFVFVVLKDMLTFVTVLTTSVEFNDNCHSFYNILLPLQHLEHYRQQLRRI